MDMIRSSAVAGAFYPASPAALASAVADFLAGAPQPSPSWPKALIAPHAGYVYSGKTAGLAFARLRPGRGTIRRVVLIGPSHRVAFRGVAVSTAEAFDTPLGPVPLDPEAIARACRLPFVAAFDSAHAQEHCLEVQLPFLKTVLGEFGLVPLVVGDTSPGQVKQVLDLLWGGPETVIVVSSDLSHYLDYDSAQTIDARTCQAIEHLDAAALTAPQACGGIGIAGLLASAKQRGLTVTTLDLCNSGDTAGPRDKVVGYGAWAFWEAQEKVTDDPAETELLALKPALLALARAAIAARLKGQPAPTLPTDLPARLSEPGAAFVTLKRNGELRGCIGSPTAWRPLAEDVADNAVRAAFHDPRFPPLSAPEMVDLTLSVSVLTPPMAMTFQDEADLLAQLVPGRDGLIIEDGGRRALFLPSVWELLPQPKAFLAHLKIKAGLPAAHWSPAFRAQRFLAVELK